MMRPEIAAPETRTVCQLTGEKSGEPSAFFRALDALPDGPTNFPALLPDAAEVEHLRAELAELRSSFAALGCLHQRAEADRDAARVELDDTMQTLRDTGAVVAVLTSQAAMWHADREEQRERADEFQDRYERAESRLTELENESAELRSQLDAMEHERDQAIAQRDVARAAVSGF
jgi:chromosome segregation ATPase